MTEPSSARAALEQIVKEMRDEKRRGRMERQMPWTVLADYVDLWADRLEDILVEAALAAVPAQAEHDGLLRSVLSAGTPERGNAEDGGLAETERLHSVNCRAQEAQRTREAEILQAGFESGRSCRDDSLRELVRKLRLADQDWAATELEGLISPAEPAPCQVEARIDAALERGAEHLPSMAPAPAEGPPAELLLNLRECIRYMEAHGSTGNIELLRQAESRIRELEQEQALIDADTQRGITDCSTPLFQRVRNIVDQLEKAESKRDEARRQLAEAESEIRKHLSPDAELDSTKLQLAELQGAIRAQDEREATAGEACGVSRQAYGCDWPDAVSEALQLARRQLVEAQQQVQALQTAAEYARLSAANDQRKLVERDQQIAQLREALKAAEQFIENGVEFGYIKMPTMAIDPALQTLPRIKAVLAATGQEKGHD